jgi:hypothetical protein
MTYSSLSRPHFVQIVRDVERAYPCADRCRRATEAGVAQEPEPRPKVSESQVGSIRIKRTECRFPEQARPEKTGQQGSVEVSGQLSNQSIREEIEILCALTRHFD